MQQPVLIMFEPTNTGLLYLKLAFALYNNQLHCLSLWRVQGLHIWNRDCLFDLLTLENVDAVMIDIHIQNSVTPPIKDGTGVLN